MKPKLERLSRVRNFLFSTPWAMTPDALGALMEIVTLRLLDEDKSWAIELAAKFHSSDSPNPGRGRYNVQDGVAVIRFVGPIMPRATVMQTSGATSLEDQMKQFRDALNNDAVKAILLDFDTPGGSAMGLEEAAQEIFNSRSQGKPVVALANAMCCSAGYYLASQADVFYCTPAAMVGSIGVRMVVESDARQKLNDGIDEPFIFTSGPLKGGAGPMTEDQKGELQKMCQTFCDNFKSAILRARPMLDVEKVSTGAVWIGKEVAANGLVDGIATFEQVMKQLTE